MNAQFFNTDEVSLNEIEIAKKLLPNSRFVEHASGVLDGNNLNLVYCTELTSLPDNLTLDGSLYLMRCKNLAVLPENLTVGCSVYLQGTRIKTIPDSAKIGGDIVWD